MEETERLKLLKIRFNILAIDNGWDDIEWSELFDMVK